MTRTLNVGVIGAGFIGAIQIEAIRRTFLGNVVALAHSTEEGAGSRYLQAAGQRARTRRWVEIHRQ